MQKLPIELCFGTLLGITQQELEQYFAPYLRQLCTLYHTTQDKLLESIAYWYNGYSWDGTNNVYVPFSMLMFLRKQTFENHWFATGTPTFLLKALRNSKTPAYDLEEPIFVDDMTLDSANINQVEPISLLFQTGYLTVKERDISMGRVRYKLGYPNHEVAQAFRRQLLADYLEMSPATFGSLLLHKFETALQAQNITHFITLLNSMFARIPYTLFLPQEAYYHSLVYLLLDLLGCEIHVERLTNLGRVDAVLQTKEAVIIMAFKMTASATAAPAESAIQQIREKQYDLPYRATGKPLIWLGIVFDYASRTITDWRATSPLDFESP